MASYNTYNDSNQTPGRPLPASQQNSNIFSSLLRSLSNWGMRYDDMLIKNQYTIGQYETAPANPSSLYDVFSTRVMAEMLSKKSLASLNPSYEQKRKLLREYAVKEDIRDFIEDICNEAIVYEQDSSRFCRLADISDQYDKRIRDRTQEIFEDVYDMIKFNESNTAWGKFKELVVDGYLCYELVFDDRGRKIINIVPVDPFTMTFGTIPVNSKMRQIWVQNMQDNNNMGERKMLLDTQVVYVSYSSALEWSEVSYVEPLIRPFNLLKLLEKTKMMWQIRNSMSYRKIGLPVQGLSRVQAMEVVGQAIADYKDDIQFDDSSGQVYVDGALKIPFSKEFWFPVGDGGSPTVENVDNAGPDMAEDKMLQWFRNNLKRASRTPFNRSDLQSGGGTVYQNNTDATREELKFTLMINRLRTIFKEILIKPIYVQMILEFPELRADKNFLRELNIIFNANNFFEYTKKLNRLQFAGGVVSQLQGMNKADGTPFFHMEFLMREVYGFTEDELEENKRWFEKDAASKPSEEAIEAATDDYGPINPLPDYNGSGDSNEGSSDVVTEESPTDTIEDNPTETPEGGEESPEEPVSV